uniref:Putative helicase n=1 Tax=viral metagenome TaxID=1070528 RepID=A0A6M3IZH4_9ZZZZ
MQAQADKATQTVMATGSQDIMELVRTDDKYAIGALLTLYGLQERDERDGQFTAHLNSVGFNRIDAPILSDMAQFYLSRGFLTEKQIAFARRAIAKYRGQLETFGVRPAELREREASKPVEPTMEAKLLADTSKFAIYFNFPFGSAQFLETAARVKTLDGRRFNGDARPKRWEAPLSVESAELLLEWGFKFSEGLAKWYGEATKTAQDYADELPDFDPRLRPFQKEGVAWIESRDGSALVGDEQGLGKTVQALAWLNLRPDVRPAVLVVPSSVKLNWAKEAEIWVQEKKRVHIISGKKPYSLPAADIYIINYDILGDALEERIVVYDQSRTPEDNLKAEKRVAKRIASGAVEIRRIEKEGKVTIQLEKIKGWVPVLKNLKPAILIGDEIQRIKNGREAQRARAMLYLARFIPRRMALSGTPIKNRAIEFFYPIQFVNQKVFPSFWKFGHRFTNAKNNGFGWQWIGSRNEQQLHDTLCMSIMIRRLKEKVLPDLPPKQRATVPMEITNRKEYEKVMDGFREWLRGTWTDRSGNERPNSENPAAAMVEIAKLRRATIAGKMDSVIDWIGDFLESGKKLIVFATHTNTLDILEKTFKGQTVRIDGTTKNRQAEVDKFQRCAKCGVNQDKHDVDPKACEEYEPDMATPLFLGNIIAAGEGITLTASSDVAFLEYSFVPADLAQAEDRAHRMKQTGSVTAWYLVAAKTIEEKLIGILHDKMVSIKSILDGKTVEKSDSEQATLAELIQGL